MSIPVELTPSFTLGSSFREEKEILPLPEEGKAPEAIKTTSKEELEKRQVEEALIRERISSPLKTTLKAELRTLKKALEIPIDGPLTLSLEKWVYAFEKAFDTALDEEETLQAYIKGLQNTLKDSTEKKSPLEEISYLCSDGYTYGEKALLTYLFKTPPTKSPVNPEEKKSFAVIYRHKIAESFVEWLKIRNEDLPPNSDVMATYADLKANHALPGIPTQGGSFLEPSMKTEKAPFAFDTHPLRRILKAEIASFKEAIKFPSDDNLTLAIEKWTYAFEKALNASPNEQEVLELFTKNLQDILRDSTEKKSPLEETSYLCSDGFVYGRKALLSYLSKTPDKQSPANPEEKKPFAAIYQHQLAEDAVQWLKTRNANLPINSDVEATYNELETNHSLPTIPTQGEASHPHSLRRELKMELLLLGNTIGQHRLQDSMTQSIKNWTERFLKALDSSLNHELILKEFIDLLQEILKDSMPLIHSPLEERSFLGSDGKVYGYKALCVYLSKMPKEHKGKSPINSDLPELFYVSPHPTIEAAIQWLKNKKASLPLHSSIEQEYTKLETTETLPKLPTKERIERQERARRLAAERAEQERLATEANSQAREAQNKERAERVNGVFEGVQSEINETNKTEKARTSKIKEKDIELLEKLRKDLEEWNQKIDDADRRVKSLEEQLLDINNDLSQSEKDTIQLKLSIQETKSEIAKRESEKNDGLTQTAFLVALCIAVSLMLPQIAPALAGGAAPSAAAGAGTFGAASVAPTVQATTLTVAPTANGTGAMIGTAIPF